MSYRDDFYIPRNIIGYTGNINNNPTVYFQNGASYGHITQAHDIRQNIGREEVCQAQDYRIFNNVHGTAEEWAGGRLYSPLTQCVHKRSRPWPWVRKDVKAKPCDLKS